VHICGASFGNLLLYEGDQFRRVALHNAPPVFAEERRRELRVRPGPKNPLARVVRTKQLQHITDIRTEEAYIEREPALVPLVDVAGARTLLILPMLKEATRVWRTGVD